MPASPYESRAIAGSDPLVPTAEDLAPFSLADAATSEHLLTSADFVEIDLAAVHEPVYYGADADAARGAALRLRHVSDLLARSAARTQALERLRVLLKAHETRDGVQFQSRAWIITSRRP